MLFFFYLTFFVLIVCVHNVIEKINCLALWTGPLEKLELFLMFLNLIDSNLQFTIEVGGNELCFLDLKLILKVIKFKLQFIVRDHSKMMPPG